jgi:AraC-like DNA-binding protein
MIKRIFFFVLFIILFSPEEMVGQNPFAQFVGKPYASYHYALRDSMRKRYKSRNIRFVNLSIRQMKSLPDVFQDGQWQLEADYLAANFNHDWQNGSTPLFEHRLTVLLEQCKEYNNTIFEIRVLRRFFDLYKDDNIIKALPYARQMEEALPKLTIEEYPDVVDCKYHIAETYLKYHDYMRAEKYDKEVVATPVFDKNQRIYILARNDLGLIMRNRYHNLNASDAWFNSIFAFDKQHPINQIRMHRIATAIGELGRNQLLRGHYQKAESLLQKALQIMNTETDEDNDHDHITVYNVLCSLAQSYCETKQYEKAASMLHKADSCYQYNIGEVSRQSYFTAESKYYLGTGRTKLAGVLMDSAFKARDSWDLKHNMNLFYETEKNFGRQELQQKTWESKANFQKYIFVLVISILIFVAFIAFIIFYIQKRKTYRALVIKNQQWAKEEKIQPDTHVLKEKEKEEADNKLYKYIENFLETSKIYCNPNLTLDTFAKEIGINRTYISNSINKTNDNFNSLINRFRIRLAIRILSEDKNKTMEEIALSTGFNNRKSFYNAFLSIAGLSPSQFKRNMQSKSEKESF